MISVQCRHNNKKIFHTWMQTNWRETFQLFFKNIPLFIIKWTLKNYMKFIFNLFAVKTSALIYWSLYRLSLCTCFDGKVMCTDTKFGEVPPLIQRLLQDIIFHLEWLFKFSISTQFAIIFIAQDIQLFLYALTSSSRHDIFTRESFLQDTILW